MSMRKIVKYARVMAMAMSALLFSCFGGPDHSEGLAKAGGGTGPQVVFNPLVKPMPEIPFPIDIATVMDDTTVTGRRLNFPVDASTRMERDIRRRLNQFDGFGTYQAISVSFDKPLDLTTLTDQSVLLIALAGPHAGQTYPLDLGKGFFPTIYPPDSYWPHDPFKDTTNLVFKDSNRMDLNGDTVAELIDFYEFETNTLIIRTIIPMDEASRYAVVITNGVKGLDGQPVRSAFEYINHTMQTNDLQPLVPILQGMGIPLNQVAFTWSFTTQSITPEWMNIVDGLYKGQGPLGYLSTAFPPVLEPTNLELAADFDGNFYTLNADFFAPILNFILPFVDKDNKYGSLADFRYIDYFVFGTYRSPTFFNNLNFGSPLIDDEHFWDPAKLSGMTPADELRVTWMLTVPKGEDVGLDGCQSASHPQGCKDFEEPGATGADNGYGLVDVDDNGDTWIDDEGEYLTQGSDDVPDPACDNVYASPADYPAHCACVVGGVPIPDYTTGECTQTEGNGVLDMYLGLDGVPGCVGDDNGNGDLEDMTEFGWPGCDDGLTEDANGDLRLNTPPFPVSLYGHGHGMANIESIGFAAPMNMFGIALMAIDAFGHGPVNDFGHLGDILKGFLADSGINLQEVCNASAISSDCNKALGLLLIMGSDLNGDKLIDANDIDGKSISQIIDEITNVGLFKVLAKEGRAYDIDGDGAPNSGDINFTANIFQTRDVMRQTAVDYMQLTRVLDNLGQQANFDLNGDTTPELWVEGDFNGDGQYDMGGPTNINTRGHFYLGSSLGGLNGALGLGVNPRILVAAPVSAAGGLVDVIPRSHHRPAMEPIVRQMAGIIVVGNYDGVDGRVTLTFNDDLPSESFGVLYLPPNGRAQITNLVNGESRIVTSDAQGNFSGGVAADVGDLLEILSLDDIAGPNRSVVYQAAKYHGLGIDRNSPDFRRFLALAQMAIEKSDPINFAGHYFTNDRGGPLPGFPEKGVLLINTVGDVTVPISSGNALASAAGLWDLGLAKQLIDQSLNIGYVPQEGFDIPLYDPEDIDIDGLECGFPAADPRCVAGDLAPTPVYRSPLSPRVAAIRWHYVQQDGHHAFAIPGMVNNGVDRGVYMLNQIGYFFASDGTCIIDDPYELHSIEYVDPGPNKVLDTVPAGDDEIINVRVLTSLGVNPCDYNFPTIPIIGMGLNFKRDTVNVFGDDIIVPDGKLYRGP